MKSDNQKTTQKLSKKIIYAWNYIEWGGAQIYFFGIISRIKHLANIEIVLPKDSDLQLLTFIENLGVRYNFFDAQVNLKTTNKQTGKIQKHWNKYQTETWLLKYLETYDLENCIVHIELAPWQSLYSLIKLCKKTEVFITSHNSLPPVPKWRYSLWKRKFSIITKYKNFHIFASNKDAKKSFEPLVPQKFYERIKVTYTNVNPDEVDEALKFEIDEKQLREKHGIPNNKTLVFCVGQFIDRKGRWTFLEAARKVYKNDKDFAFVWISNSKPSVEDLEKAKSYGLNDDFIFITSDEVGGEHIDLFKLLRLADIFALVSFQEGLPISLLEAMALGIPSISTNVNAIPEAVKHLETGWLIEAGDSVQLAEALTKLKDNKGLREKLSKNGREFVLENFNEKVVAKIVLEAYQESLTEK